jgi:hypothetical protein
MFEIDDLITGKQHGTYNLKVLRSGPLRGDLTAEPAASGYFKDFIEICFLMVPVVKAKLKRFPGADKIIYHCRHDTLPEEYQPSAL